MSDGDSGMRIVDTPLVMEIRVGDHRSKDQVHMQSFPDMSVEYGAVL